MVSEDNLLKMMEPKDGWEISPVLEAVEQKKQSISGVMFLSDVENMEVLEVLVYFLAMNGISQQARRCYRKGPEINQQSHPTSDQEPLIYHLPTKDPLNGPNGMDSSPNNWLGVFHIRSLIQ